jgi:hemerythrin-like domain-containing protein
MMTQVKATAVLIDEHKVIRAQMDFLTSALNNMATGRTPGRDALTKCRYGLYDLKDGLRHHHESDEYIIKTYSNRAVFDSVIKEHKIIQDKIEAIIALTEQALETGPDQTDLVQYMRRIRDTLIRTRRFIETHHAKEDKLLKSLQSSVL